MSLKNKALALVCIIVAWPATAQLELTVTGGSPDAVPIAIVPFGYEGEGTSPFDLASVVAADLQRSGRFAPVPARSLVEQPHTAADVDFSDWAVFDVEVVVVGRVIQEGDDEYRIVFEVMDVPRRSRLLGFSLSSNRQFLRATAHNISDVIYEKLTGERGIFSTHIAYISAEQSRGEYTYKLIVADADGENQTELLTTREPIMSPAWSPDGRSVAYVAFENGSTAIYVQDVTRAQRRRISAQPGVNGAPAWSPDGSRLALTLSNVEGNLDVHVLRLLDGQLTRLTRSRAIDTEPAWTPDGNFLYFNSDRSGGPQAYLVDADGGPAQRQTFEGRYNARPRVSPDGSLLALVHQDGGAYRIATMDLQNRAMLVLSDGSQDESPSFAPNGATIIYATQEGGRGVLATVSTDGRVKQRLSSRGRDVREPVWGPFIGGTKADEERP